MAADQVPAFISYLGLLAQTAAALLLVVLFWLLRPYARRNYFAPWSWAWSALAVALLALVWRYLLLTPGAGEAAVDDSRVGVKALYAAYQVGKVTYLWLIAVGTVLVVRGKVPAALGRLAAGLGLVYAVLTAVTLGSLNAIVLAQAPLAVAVFGGCAAALARLPAPRRSLGTRLTATVLAVLAGLWVVYFVSFAAALDLTPFRDLRRIARFNGYFDLILQQFLGFAMILLLLEDARREVDDAYSQLGLAYDHLRRAALVDPLTGCLNRLALDERVGLAALERDFGTVVALDLDNLKTVNDTCGHAAGDALLQQLARGLLATLHPGDRVYRVGGDEFVALLRRGRAAQVAPRLLPALEGLSVTLGDLAKALPLEVSAGFADYETFGELERAMAEADRAMYVAKRRRKGATR
jgi:diguanylate cyclase (GGDEF)-like protein